MNINTGAYQVQAGTDALTDNAKFKARAAKFKELTGREIVVQKNETGDFIHMLHPESTQRLGFVGEFFRVGFNSPDGFEATIEALARKYVQLKEELTERYGDDEYELYNQLGQLNTAFESALQSTVLVSLQTPLASGVTFTVSQHLDIFFETFIKNIQSTDFDAAFANSFDVFNDIRQEIADLLG